MSGNDRAELMDLYQRHNKNGSCFSIRHVGNVIMKYHAVHAAKAILIHASFILFYDVLCRRVIYL